MSALEHSKASGTWRAVATPRIILLFLCGIPASAALGQPPRARLVEELRLSAVSEDFPEVSRVNVGPAGQIGIPITADLQLRIYDARGRRLTDVGRQGGGPGEFFSIGPFGWVRDTIWIVDPKQFRTTFVGPENRVLRSERFPAGRVDGVALGGEIESVAPLAILHDGSVLGQVRWVPRDERGTAGEPQQAFAVRHANSTIRPVLRIPSGRSAPWSIATFACCTFYVPFVPRPLYAISADGQRLAELTVSLPTQLDGKYRVTLVQATGDTVFSTLHSYRGEPIPQRAQDSALAVVVPAPGHLLNVPANLSERVRDEARARMPSWSAPMETLLVGLDGTIWVEFRPNREGRRYLVLNDRGEPIGEVLVPFATRVRQATRSHIWVTETDADGLSDVVRYRVVGLRQAAVRR